MKKTPLSSRPSGSGGSGHSGLNKLKSKHAIVKVGNIVFVLLSFKVCVISIPVSTCDNCSGPWRALCMFILVLSL